MFTNEILLIIEELCEAGFIISSIARPVLDHYVLVSGGGVRVSDVAKVGV